ncbi:type VI secretion system protein TssA [Candidatus Schmidhempelia bombi str. Bimp]|uniref:Type VI secretion system protein TssA n=2 Tax=Candidatus Schmidhempelia TaxID=1505768 RepID=A0AB94IBW4_9GAMM|nr:type VI secretion system protein TssA [Candidatus Schmidhempelia bombi str. Bimp]
MFYQRVFIVMDEKDIRMLAQLISSLFEGKDAKQDIERRLKEKWHDWLMPISADKPTGDDPTYTDNFQLIKEEIAKLSGIDAALIINTSEDILKNSSKDIRVASYYCWAKLKTEGIEGFTDGIELLAGLLSYFTNDLFPSREHIRKNSIEWLAQTKFTELLNACRPIPTAELERIIAAIELIKQTSQSIFSEENQPDLSALIQFFAGNVKSSPKPSTPEPVASSEPVNVSSPQALYDNSLSTNLRSQRDVLDQARRIAVFLREKPEGYLAAGRLLRTLRWDTIHMLPPCDHTGKTRLPAPRTELRNNIQRLVISQDWRELFERVETAFMEGTNHFWLDLQRYAVMALQKMGPPSSEWAEIYLTDVGLMLDRLKGIERLTYENGMPFADDETLNWITHSAMIHHLDGEASLPPIALNNDDNNWDDIAQQAVELANKENLASAFTWLQNLPMLVSPKQRFLLRYTQAKVAEYVGEKEVALRLLELINSQQQQISLVEWEADLWFDIKSHLLKLLKQKWQLKESNKVAIMQQIEKINDELMHLDPARAMAIAKV